MITVDAQQMKLPVESFEEFTAILAILNSPNPSTTFSTNPSNAVADPLEVLPQIAKAIDA
jgi:hypothetical protein